MPRGNSAGYAPIHTSPRLSTSHCTRKVTNWDKSDDENEPVPLSELLARPVWEDGFALPRELVQRAFRIVPQPLRRPVQVILLALILMLIAVVGTVHHVTAPVYADLLADAISSRGWEQFTARTPPRHTSLERVSSDKILIADCLDEWISQGSLCAEAQGAFANTNEIDVIYAWTNGTDILQDAWRAAIGPPINRATARHFREHDELRYSIRAILAAFGTEAVQSIKLLTADFPLDREPFDSLSQVDQLPSRVEGATHLGQIPHWLNQNVELPKGYPPLEVVHHSSTFTNASQLPVFNSLPIEASLHNLNLSSLSMYTNDDFFLGIRSQSLVPSDMGSALLGPMLRIDRHFLFGAHSPEERSEGKQEGEWWGITRGNWLLSRRFGMRKRGYLNHVPKSVPRALVREAAQHFEWALDTTSQSRFRGSKLEFQPFFIWHHYIVEKHREALLWSYLVARSDTNHDGRIDHNEAQALLADLGMTNSTEEGVNFAQGFVPRRLTLRSLARLNAEAGVHAPLSSVYEFSSSDGYIMTGAESHLPDLKLWPVVGINDGQELAELSDGQRELRSSPACAIELARCFPGGFGEERRSFNTSDVFKRAAFEEPTCGDCAILILQGKTARGLEQFLPPRDNSPLAAADDDKKVDEPFALGKQDFGHISFLPTPTQLVALRRACVQMINRYSYTIGSSPMTFIMFRNVHDSILSLGQLNDAFSSAHGGAGRTQGSRSPVFTTMNDDLDVVGQTEEFDRVLKEFFEMEWPERSAFERGEEGEM